MSSASLSIDPASPKLALVQGDWTLDHCAALDQQLQKLDSSIQQIDASGLERLDSSGAMLLAQMLKEADLPLDALRLHDEHRALFDTVRDTLDQLERDAVAGEDPLWQRIFEPIGRATMRVLFNAWDLVGFLGLTLHRLVRTILQPSRMRWTSLVHHMQETGLNAVPLLALLSAMIGAVVAFLGATVLADFGAELMVIDLVVFAFLREFGVLLTAILLAGRTASAFCAQIGMMKGQQEIDAIRTLGLDEVELLVVPRVLALLIMLPALAVIATMAGLLGGLIVSVLSLNIGVELYIERVYQTVRLQDYLIGLIKAPIFALVIALIGCSEGLRVRGTAQSVGEHTTSAVVRSLTMVIVIDAIAAIYFMEIGW